MATAKEVKSELDEIKRELAGAKPVSYIVFESSQARQERHIKRLVIALIISAILIYASNALWLYVWEQYDYSSTSTETVYTQDGEGVNIIGDCKD